MPISLVRIDDRVIHGQVITKWSRWKPCNGILIVDDKIATDPIEKRIFSNAAPSGIRVGIYTIEEGVEKINKAKTAKNSYFVIVRSPVSLKKLKALGADFGSEVNVGPMSGRENTRYIGKNASVTDEEIKAFEYLFNEDINITFQLVPEETAYNWNKVRKKLI